MASTFSKAFAMLLNVKIVDGDDLIAAQGKAKLCGLQRSSAFMIPFAGKENMWISEGLPAALQQTHQKEH